MSLNTDAVLVAIDTVRSRDGACSLRTLATELGVSHTGARYWVNKLANTGLVETSDQGGSIRRVGAPDLAEVGVLVGTITLGISYKPDATRPLIIEVLGTTGAAATAVAATAMTTIAELLSHAGINL